MRPVCCAVRRVLTTLLPACLIIAPAEASPPVAIGLSPSSGVVLTGQCAFVSTFSDSNGYSDIVDCRVLINTRLIGSGGIFLRYDASANRLYLRDDANAAWLGGSAPGASANVDNSLCTLHCAQTTVTGAADLLTVTWRLTLKQAASGAQYSQWLYAGDPTSGTPWVPAGSIRVNQAPANDSIEPATGKVQLGRDVNLVTRSSDGDGWGDIAEVRVLLNTSLTGAGGIFLRYDTRTGLLHMRNDANTAWLGGYVPTTSNAIENSSALLNCNLTTVQGSGSQLRINWRLNIKTVAPGQVLKGWLYVVDRWGTGTPWHELALLQPDGPPQSVSLSPSSGNLATGSYLTLSSAFQDPAGANDLSECFLFVNTPATGGNGLYVRYDANANLLYASSDAGVTWAGGFPPGSPNTIETPWCVLDCSGTSVASSGLRLTVNWRLLLKGALASPSAMAWHYAFDDADFASDWQQVAAFYINQPPANLEGVAPSQSVLQVGQPVTFTTRVSDPDGYADVGRVYALINTVVSGHNAVYLMYDAAAAKLYLRNSANTGWLGGFPCGSAEVIENDFVALHCSGTTVSGSQATVTINWSLVIKAQMPLGPSKAWLFTTDVRGLADGWDQMGAVTIRGCENRQLSPSSGYLPTGTPAALESTHSCVAGYSRIVDARVLLNTAISGAGGVFVYYDVRSNRLYLRSDNGGSWLGGFAPGSANVIENNQCILDCAGTSVHTSGEDMRVSWSLVLKTAILGRTLGAWMYTADDSGVGVGWEEMGTFVVAVP